MVGQVPDLPFSEPNEFRNTEAGTKRPSIELGCVCFDLTLADWLVAIGQKETCWNQEHRERNRHQEPADQSAR